MAATDSTIQQTLHQGAAYHGVFSRLGLSIGRSRVNLGPKGIRHHVLAGRRNFSLPTGEQNCSAERRHRLCGFLPVCAVRDIRQSKLSARGPFDYDVSRWSTANMAVLRPTVYSQTAGCSHCFCVGSTHQIHNCLPDNNGFSSYGPE